MIAHYVHDLNPVIFSITETMKLRWYGFSYMMAFVVGYLLLRYLAKRKLWVLKEDVVGDFIALGAFFGVFLGGRIGNVLVYQRDELMEDPLMIFRVWEGGMASHGGILGLMLFTYFYSRKKNVSWTGLGDGLCVVAPLGIMFGRLANFINGELYGNVARAHAWAMKFPNTLFDPRMVESKSFAEAQAAAAAVDVQYADYLGQVEDYRYRFSELQEFAEGSAEYQHFEALLRSSAEQLNAAVRRNDAVADAIAQFLEPRFPSQLFQAAGEGLALFLILWIVRLRFPRLYNGVLTGLFFIFYAIFRISMEHFREPEIDNVNFLWMEMTMGQFLSVFMIFIGVVFIAVAAMRKKNLYTDGIRS